MNDKNSYFFIDPTKKGDYEIPIYRFIPVEYFQDMLLSNTLKISQTKDWDDTYENFLSKVEYYAGGNLVSYHGFKNDFYGQCWTVKKESDALWRIYSHDKKGVRIKTTVQKLMKAVVYGNELFPRTSRANIIGKVNYMTQKEIEKWVHSLKTVSLGDMRNSLFMKRMEFEHEDEVRLIIHKLTSEEDDAKGIEHQFVDIKFNPLETIDEVTFDPRLSEEVFKRNRHILKKLGFTKRINQSKLYHFNPIKRPFI